MRAPVRTEAGNVIGADWGPDDTIVFAEREGLQLSRISADGGAKQVLLEDQVFDPAVLPDGSGILLTQSGSIVLVDTATSEIRTLIDRGRGPHYVPTGHIVYTDGGGISAIPFDLLTKSVTGPAVPVLDDVRREGYGISQLAFSADGWLAYIPGADTRISKLLWVSRNGIEDPIPLPPQNYGTFRLSPDGSQVALLINGSATDVWLFDFKRATPPRRLTVGGNKVSPIWSPDGQRVAFGAFDVPNQGSGNGIFQQGIDGGPVLPLVRSDAWMNPGSWATSGVLTYYSEWDIWVARQGELEDPEVFVRTSASEWGPALSPDGRFIAYTSDESGEYQVYVKPYPATEARWTISAGYGEEPLWSAAGDEIFFRRGQEWLSVPVKTDPDFEAGTPQVMFEGPYVNVNNLSYDVAPDAQRFLLLKRQDQPPATRIHVVANWFEELQRLAPSTE